MLKSCGVLDPSLPYTDHIARVKPTVSAISIDALERLLRHEEPQKYHLFDVREPYEWNEERIPTAKYTGRGHLEKLVEAEASATDDILLYCSNGNRSILSADSLKSIGFQNVKYLEGGISAWKLANKTVSRNMRAVSN
ncbi:Rhodanese-like domain-containing protein [Obelidium mucronatum]|nr:Rhodanese-like domain-containing protein [Obelidium mucronatum]